MTNSEPEQTDGPTEGISDEQLPEDLRPSEDNPLAEPLSEEDAPDDLADLDMTGGKTAEETSEDSSEESGEDSGDAEEG